MVNASLMPFHYKGVLHLLPYKASNEDISMLEWQLLLYDNLINLRCSSHAFLKVKMQALSMSFSVWIVHLVCPSVAESNAMLKFSLVLNTSCSFC